MRRAATLGDEIIRRGLNQEQTAVLGRVQPSTVQRIVAGQVRASPKTIVSLAKALGIGATRMQAMCEAHWLAAHPDEDLSGGIVTPPPRNAYGRPPRPGSRPGKHAWKTHGHAPRVLVSRSSQPRADSCGWSASHKTQSRLRSPDSHRALCSASRRPNSLSPPIRQPLQGA